MATIIFHKVGGWENIEYTWEGQGRFCHLTDEFLECNNITSLERIPQFYLGDLKLEAIDRDYRTLTYVCIRAGDIIGEMQYKLPRLIKRPYYGILRWMNRHDLARTPEGEFMSIRHIISLKTLFLKIKRRIT